jgi:hypothetical protein
VVCSRALLPVQSMGLSRGNMMSPSRFGVNLSGQQQINIFLLDNDLQRFCFPLKIIKRELQEFRAIVSCFSLEGVLDSDAVLNHFRRNQSDNMRMTNKGYINLQRTLPAGRRIN